MPADGRPVAVRVQVRRLWCPVLACPVQTFREQVQGVLDSASSQVGSRDRQPERADTTDAHQELMVTFGPSMPRRPSGGHRPRSSRSATRA